jgi:hypothetical protein
MLLSWRQSANSRCATAYIGEPFGMSQVNYLPNGVRFKQVIFQLVSRQDEQM